MKKNGASLKKDRNFLHGEEVEEGTSAGGRETLWGKVSSHQCVQDKSSEVLKSGS